MKGPQERNRHKNRVKGVGKLGWFMSKTQTLTSPPREGEPAGTEREREREREKASHNIFRSGMSSGDSFCGCALSGVPQDFFH